MGKLAGLCCSGFQGVCQFCTHIFVLSEVCAAGTTNKSFGAKRLLMFVEFRITRPKSEG